MADKTTYPALDVAPKHFIVEESQVKKLNKWQAKIKKKHGEYGLYQYIFTPTGIGDIVEVYSELDKTKIDLTEVEKW